MSLSLKMLPCKKRRAAVAGPQSPRERGGAGEDGELPGAGGSSSAGAAEGGGGGGSAAKLAPAARADGPRCSGPGAWRGPGEASLKGGKRPPGRTAPGSGQEAPGPREACAAAPLPEGLGSPAAVAEGKRALPVSAGVAGSAVLAAAAGLPPGPAEGALRRAAAAGGARGRPGEAGGPWPGPGLPPRSAGGLVGPAAAAGSAEEHEVLRKLLFSQFSSLKHAALQTVRVFLVLPLCLIFRGL